MNNYRDLFNTKQTPQTQPIPGSNQVANSAGGYVWQVDDWTQLNRFLILGSSGGTYYIKPQKLTKDNAQAVIRCIQRDGRKTVDTIVDISRSGRASSNDPALFALALAASFGDDDTRRYALANLSSVARIGTHLYHFADYVDGLRGWGRGLRQAIANWFLDKDVDKLAYQMVKYQQRDGWSARDLLRLSHPKTGREDFNALFSYVTKGTGVLEILPRIITGVETIKTAKSVGEVVSLITEYGLDREMVPTQWLNEKKVWEALLAKGMPIEAMTRNLAKMTSLGMMDDRTTRHLIEDTLTNQDQITRSRLHPMKLLKAYKTYAAGKGDKGSLVWTPNLNIRDALDSAFYLAFGNVQPTGKEMLLALDVSGSMGAPIMDGSSGNGSYGMWGASPSQITCAEGAAVMAMVTKRVERDARIMAFSHKFVELNISPKDSLQTVLGKTRQMNFGSTDCSLPMVWAMQNGFKAEGIAVYTDNETYAGRSHPAQELRNMRQKFGIDTRMAVVGMASNGFTIADPNDKGSLDVVGFDTNTPNVLSEFFGGKI